MDLKTRAQWGARPPKRFTRGNLKDRSTLHYNGPDITVLGRLFWDHSKCDGLVRGIQNFHMDGHGWSDIAYNFLVCPHGTVYEGRGLNIINAANGTNVGNKTSHTIMCLAGENNPFTDAEKAGILMCLQYIDNRTDAPGNAIPHSDWHSTQCCGDTRRNWIRGGFKAPASPPSAPAYIPTPPEKASEYGAWPNTPSKPVLKHGSTGNVVRYLQGVIYKKAGGNIAVDGVFGVGTENRVKDVQRLFKLTADGVVGPKTWAVIDYIALH